MSAGPTDAWFFLEHKQGFRGDLVEGIKDGIDDRWDQGLDVWMEHLWIVAVDEGERVDFQPLVGRCDGRRRLVKSWAIPGATGSNPSEFSRTSLASMLGLPG